MKMRICPYCSGKAYSASFREDWKCPCCDRLVRIEDDLNSKNNEAER